MADYKSMYHKLVIEMTDTIERFQSRLLETEEMYISTEETTVTLYQNKEDKKQTDDN